MSGEKGVRSAEHGSFPPPWRIRLDAVGAEGCKASIATALPGSVAAQCDLCGAGTDNLHLACPDCCQKTALFNSFVDETAHVHEDEVRMKTLQAHRSRLAGMLLTQPKMSVYDIADILAAEGT